MIIKVMREYDGCVLNALNIQKGETTIDEVIDFVGNNRMFLDGEHEHETKESREKRIKYYFDQCETLVINDGIVRVIVFFKCHRDNIIYMDKYTPTSIYRVVKNNLKKDKSYLALAETNAMNGTCIRRKYGAIIVNNDEIISTGYVGAPRGRANCNRINKCRREELQIPSGERYELCESVHAEMNAIISAARRDMKGGTMYLVGIENDGSINPNTYPCLLCQKMLIQSGLEWLVYTTTEDRNPMYVNIKKEFVDKYNREANGNE